MTWFHRFLPVFFLLLLAAALHAQKSVPFPQVQQAVGNFKHFNTGSGLSHRNITCLLQDNSDFIWAGSSDGLNRLDGKNILNFFHDAREPESLSSNNIHMMAEGRKGDLLITTETGLNAFSPKDNRFRLVFHPAGGKAANLIFRDAGNHHWLSSEDRLFELDENYRKIREWTMQLAGQGNVDIICAASSGRILVSKGGWINLIHPAEKRVENRMANPRNLRYLNEKIRHVAFERKAGGGFWILTANFELMHFGENGERLKSTQTNPEMLFMRLFLSKSNELWIGSRGKGLFRYEEKNGTFTQYSHRSSKPESISGNYINGMLEDEAGNFWVYTSEGLDVMKKTDPAFQVLSDFGKEKYLPDMPLTLTALYAFNNELWLGTWGRGLCHLNQKTGKREFINGGKASMENLIWDLLPDQDGIWFSSYGGLHRHSFKEKNVVSFRSLPQYPVKRDSIAVIKLFRDSRKNIWASFLGNYGMMCISPDGKKMRYFQQDSTPGFSLPHFDAIAEDGRGSLWLGHRNKRGILIYNPRKNIFFKLPHYYDFTNCLLADKNAMWLGSKNGLFRLDKGGNITHHFTRKDGLPNNQVSALVKDARGRIWAGTDNGLFFVDQDFGIRSVPIPDAGSEEEITDAKIAASGFLHLVSTHRVITFHPDSLHLNKVVLKPAFTRMMAGGQVQNFSTGKILSIPPDAKSVSFEYSAPSFLAESPVRFSRMLKGLENKWSEVEPGNISSYSNLPPGRFEFCLRATIDGKTWFMARDKIIFEVEVPLHRQTWFLLLLLCGIFIFATLGIILYYRIRLEKIRYGQAIRNKISEDIHDDISLGLTRIIWISERLIGKNEPFSGKEMLQHILSSARETASKLGEIVWAVNPEHDNLEAFLSYLRNYTSSFLEEIGIDWEIHFPEPVPDMKMDSELVRNLFLLAKESLNNAVKHSKAKKISLAFSLLSPERYHLEISDDGEGFDAGEKKESGNGLRNAENRSKKIKAELNIRSSPGVGCTISISGPVY